MNSKSAIRFWVYGACVIPALLLFIENRFFVAGGVGWLLIVAVVVAIVEFSVRSKERKVVSSPPSQPSPPSPNLSSIEPAEPSISVPSENNQPPTLEYDMESDKEWCPLAPKELIKFVSHKDATEVARQHRSAMYEGKLLQVRGVVKDVNTFTLNSNYRIELQDTLEYPWSWSVNAEVRSDQDDYVISLRRGDQVTVTGTIGTVSSYIGLEDSYLDHSTTIPHPKNLVEPLDKTNISAWFVAALARSFRQIDSESDTMLSRRLLDALERHINEIGEEVDYLATTKPRGEDLRFMLTLLNRWCENPPQLPNSDKS